MRVARLQLLVVALAAVMWIAWPAAAQTGVDLLFTDVTSARAEAEAEAVARTQRADAPVVRRRIAGMQVARLFGDGSGTTRIGLNLFGETLVATLDRVDTHNTGHRSWVGRVDGDALSNVNITERDGVVSGVITTRGETYAIRTMGVGTYAIEQMDVSRLPREAEPVRPPSDLSGAPFFSGVADSGGQIDVLFLYTPAARTGEGGESQMAALIAQIVSDSNTAFQRSGVSTTFRSVGSTQVSLTETTSNMLTDLNTITNSATVLALRNQVGADLVQLIGHGYTDACGMAWLMNTNSTTFEVYGYSVADHDCAFQYTPTHEMGHNMGSHHAPEDGASGALYSYSYGYKSAALAFRTIMAYACSGSTCSRVLNFSNPNVTHNGGPTGTTTQNNALSLNNAANAVANFRQAVTTTTTVPSAPTGLASTVSGSQVTLGWNAVTTDTPQIAASAATSYLLQVGTSAGASNLYNANVGNVTTVSGSVGNGTYFWRVYGVNSAGTGAASSEAQFTVGSGTCTSAPSAPQNFTHTVSGSAVSMSWQAPASGTATDYTLEAGSAPGLANLYNASVGNVLGTSATAGAGTYYVRVRASNACGTSGPSNERTIVIQ